MTSRELARRGGGPDPDLGEGVVAALDALAREVLGLEALAGVQILTVDASGYGLEIVGSAGLRPWPDFFERLVECRERGAASSTIESWESRKPVVVPEHREAIDHDPSWEPLHEYLAELSWGWFVSVPLVARGRTTGVLNAYVAPGRAVGGRMLDSLVASADRAARALDRAARLDGERELARLEERRRLARDLHDVVAPEVFSISLQARSMEVLGAHGDAVPAAAVRRHAEEVARLAGTVLADLRAIVGGLAPTTSSPGHGLGDAVRALIASTAERNGVLCTLSVAQGVDDLGPERAEDLHRIVAEALHNVEKHAGAGHVTLRLSVRAGAVVATVSDDGVGLPLDGARARSDAFGLTSMRERAERWGGTLEVDARPGGGTSVRAALPLPAPTPGTPVVAAGGAGHAGSGRSTVRPAPVSVLVVDDHAVVRSGLAAYVEVLEDVHVAAEAGDGQEALDRLEAMAARGDLPDVVLLDLVMPTMDGATATARIVERHPGLAIVVFTSFGETERVHAALAAGASGFLLKDARPEEVVAAIRAAARGDLVLDPRITRQLAQEIVAPPAGSAALTARERGVLALLARGRSNQEIADELVISERTTRNHVSHVLRKLGLTSRTQAALFAVRQGLAPPLS